MVNLMDLSRITYEVGRVLCEYTESPDPDVVSWEEATPARRTEVVAYVQEVIAHPELHEQPDPNADEGEELARRINHAIIMAGR